ncbi:MAG: PilN domain-containing protein [Solirubrobacterales bacterium]
MRPINLIPPEERRGENAPLRTGPLAYVVLGALVLLLVGVIALVLAGNQISERETEVAKLEREDTKAAAKAQRLAAYTQFQQMSEQRVATVSDLADSRFDWERVMRELSLVLPTDVWLTGLVATASPDVSVEGGGGDSAGASLRAQVPGPALELNGCAAGQDAVAGFVTALKDVDGVTRVGVQSSELGEEEEEVAQSTEVGSDTAESGEECQTRAFIAKFAVVVAFDAAPVAASAEEAEAAPAESAETSASGEASEGAEGE